MKTIGYIEPAFTTDDGEITMLDPEYEGGTIVQLTQRETALLIKLQDAWDGGVFRWPPSDNEKLDEREMNSAFKAIQSFIEMKFAVNEFRNTIDRLDDLLKNGEGNEL